MSRRRPRSAEAASSSSAAAAAAVDYEDVSRFQQLLEAYFKPVAPVKAPKTTLTPKRSSSNWSASALLAAATAPEQTVAAAPAERTLEGDLKQLKCWLRNASPASQAQLTKRVFDVVSHQLKRAKRSSSVFTRVVALCTELFARSVAFRALVATNAAAFYEQLLEAAGEPHGAAATAGAASAKIAAPARARNAQLQRVLTMLEAWKEGFGDKYPAIAAGHAALEQRGFVFPRVRETQSRDAQQDAVARELRQRIRQVQIGQMQREAPEIEDVIVEMNRIFDILVPTLDAFNFFDDLSPRASGGDSATNGDTRTDEGQATKSSAAVASADTEDAAGSSTNDDGDGAVDWEDVPDDDADDVEWEDVGEAEHRGYEQSESEDSGEYEEDEDSGGDDSGSKSLSRLDMNQIVQAYGLGSSSYQLTIEIPTRDGMCAKSSDNEALFQHLADGILRIRKRFLPLVHDWKQHIQYEDGGATGGNEVWGESAAAAAKAAGAPSTAAASGDRDSRADRALAYRVDDLQHRLELIVSKWEDLVEESEKKQFARITPSIVSLPVSAYLPRLPPPAVGKRRTRADVLAGRRKRKRGQSQQQQ